MYIIYSYLNHKELIKSQIRKNKYLYNKVLSMK